MVKQVKMQQKRKTKTEQDVEKYLHEKVIEIPLYRGKFVIVFSNDVEKLKSIFPDFEDDEIYAHAWIANWRKFEAVIIMLNFHNDFRKIHHGVITHEIIHMTSFISIERGITLDPNNDEPICYLAEWMTDEVYKFVKTCGFLDLINFR